MAAIPPPLVTWAQRHNLVILTVCLEDCDKPDIKVESDSLYFKGTGGPDKKPHEVTMKFFKEIDPEKTKYAVRPRVIEFALEKKEAGPYWDRLLADKTKRHWLRVDFNKWKDEDESEDEEGGQNLEDMMRNMGGLGGGGMPGMGGMGGMPGMGGMGGMPGMGGAGMPGMPGMGDMGKMGNIERPSLDDLDAEGDDSDDEDLPDLE